MMRKVTVKSFFKTYISFIVVMLIIYFILGPSGNTSIPLLMILAFPITGIILFTGLDEKLKRYLP